jgi:hypothetical protein
MRSGGYVVKPLPPYAVVRDAVSHDPRGAIAALGAIAVTPAVRIGKGMTHRMVGVTAAPTPLAVTAQHPFFHD